MTAVQIKAFNQIIKIGEIDLDECEESVKTYELKSNGRKLTVSMFLMKILILAKLNYS